jgi:hypothetical protein
MKLYALLNIILCFSGTLYAQVINDASTIEFGSKNISLYGGWKEGSNTNHHPRILRS